MQFPKHRRCPCAASGFSMIEILVTMVFVVLISMLIQGSFLRAADLFGRYTHTLWAMAWSNEEIPKIREALLRKEIGTGTQSGHLDADGKDISWTLGIKSLSDNQFYSIKTALAWTESGKPYSYEKESYFYARDNT